MDQDIISVYTNQQAIEDGLKAEIFTACGTPVTATASVVEEFSRAALIEIWNDYVAWRRYIEPTLPEEERLFSTTMNSSTLWVLEDGECFTILRPSEY